MVALKPCRTVAVAGAHTVAALHPRPRQPTVCRLGDSRGGAVLDRPDFLTGDRSSTPDTESGRGATEGNNRRGMGGGNHRVLLLDSPNHTEDRVVQAILTVIPGTDESHAANCFHTARSLGMALVTTALLEVAEHYAQELYRRGCKTTIEPDTTTL